MVGRETWVRDASRGARRFGARSFPVGAGLGIVLLLGCGPEVETPQDWMLDVFSTRHPDPDVEIPVPGGDSVLQYHLYDDGTLQVYRSNSMDGGAPQLGSVREWEPRGQNELAFFPPADYNFPTVEWRVTRMGDCGPHKVEELKTDGNINLESYWYRGSTCVRFGETWPDCNGRPFHEYRGTGS